MKSDGGAAFPSKIIVRTVNTSGDLLHEEQYGTPGLTARDWFAGQAMRGFVTTGKDVGHGEYETTVAEFAYAQADAMLAERERTGANNG